MGDFPVANRKNSFNSAPRPFAAAGGPGQVSCFAVTSTAGVLDLTKGFSMGALDLQVSGQSPKTPTRNYISIEADVDVAVIFGPTLASVTSTHAPAFAAVGTVDASGVYTGAEQTAWAIKANTPQRFLMQAGKDMFLGLVGAGTGVVRIYQSSPDDA